MSWLKFNDSFNTLKGQISNVSNVVQEVFSETIANDDEPIDDDNRNADDSKEKIQDLTNLCATQDVELNALRQKILELQQQNPQLQQQHHYQTQQLHGKNTDINSTKSLQPDNHGGNNTTSGTSGGTFEDSWFWESEQTTVSSKSSGSGSDLTTIPLDITGNGNHSTVGSQSHDTQNLLSRLDKYRKLCDEKDVKIKTITLENAILNEKVNQLTVENKEISENIEELDKQHCQSIERVLTLKNDLQENANQLQTELSNMRLQQFNDSKSHSNEIEQFRLGHDELKSRFDKLQQSYVSMENSYVTGVQTNMKLQSEIDVVKLQLEKSMLDNVESSISVIDRNDKFELIDIEKTAPSSLSSVTVTEQSPEPNVEDLIPKSQESCVNCTKLLENHSELLDEIQNLKEIQSQFETFKNDNLILKNKYDQLIEDHIKLTEKNNEIIAVENDGQLQLQIELRQLHEDYNALQEADLDLQREHHRLNEEQQKLLIDMENIRKKNDDGVAAAATAATVAAIDDENQKLLKNQMYQLEIENQQTKQDLIALQESDLELQRENGKLKESLMELENAAVNKIEKILYDELKQEASENESKLVQENVLLHKQLIDLNAQLNNSLTEAKLQHQQSTINNITDNDDKTTIKETTNDSITIDNLKMEIKSIIKSIDSDIIIDCLAEKNEDDDVNADSNITINEFLRLIITGVLTKRSEITKIEKEFIDLRVELNALLIENSNLKHERDTIQADLGHYENEVSELMKNNDLLLNELHALKNSDLNQSNAKLETISECNEEQIITLERQLDDCTVINQTLEDEYQMIRHRLDESDTDKEMFLNRIETLEIELETSAVTIKSLKLHLENLENEKSNILFEMHELKSKDEPTDTAVVPVEVATATATATTTATAISMDDAAENYEHKFLNVSKKLSVLQEQYERLQLERLELISKLDALEGQAVEQQSFTNEIISQQSVVIRDHENLVRKKSSDVEKLTEEIDSLKIQLNNLGNQPEVSTIESLQLDINQLQQTVNDSELKNLQYLETIKKLNDTIKNLQEQLLQIPQSPQELHHECHLEMENLKLQLDQMNGEKNEFIRLITVKHEENINYHNEIKRLNELLNIEIEKSTQALNKICPHCEETNEKLRALQVECEKLNDQITFLREKSDILQQNLFVEQTTQKQLQLEKQDLLTEKQNVLKDLTRLREHLMEIEDAHTQETIELQKIIETTNLKMNAMENDAKKSSNAYTSASIRANQQTETLQTQYMLLQQQRDDYANKLNLAEDAESKNEAALINLQCALEQFQKDKERDVQALTHRIRKDLENEKLIQKQLQDDIQSLNRQLTEAKHGLLAAARLSDQLEIAQVMNSNLKEDLSKTQQKINNLETKLNENETNQADKVEKGLLKNLLIGYVVAPNPTDKSQILKLISSVLDFNQSESDKVGLNHRSHVGWFNSILRNANPNNSDYNKEGLAQAFVKFLEKESQPKENLVNTPTLLNMIHETMPSTTVLPLPPQQIRSNSTNSNDSNENRNNNNNREIVDSTIAAAAFSVQPIDLNSSINQIQQFHMPATTIPTTAAPTSITTNNNNNNNQVVQKPILISTTDSMLYNHPHYPHHPHHYPTTFMPQRNSSSILKDILNDSSATMNSSSSNNTS